MGPKRVVKKKVLRKVGKPGMPAGSDRPFLSSTPKGPAPGHSLRRTGPKKPAAGYAYAAESDSTSEFEEELGIGDFTSYAVVLLCVLFVIFVFLPVNLSHVEGYPFQSSKVQQNRNLLQEAEKKLLEGTGGTIEFTEGELNTYLHQRVRASQGGPLRLISDVDGVYVDLLDKGATLYLVQHFIGIPFVVSSTWEYYLENQKYVRNCTGSSVGLIRFKGLLLAPLMAPFVNFVEACKPEANLLDLEAIENVQIEKGMLKLQLKKKP